MCLAAHLIHQSEAETGNIYENWDLNLSTLKILGHATTLPEKNLQLEQRKETFPVKYILF